MSQDYTSSILSFITTVFEIRLVPFLAYPAILPYLAPTDFTNHQRQAIETNCWAPFYGDRSSSEHKINDSSDVMLLTSENSMEIDH